MNFKLLHEDILDVVKELHNFKEVNKVFLITGATGTLASFLISTINENNKIYNANNRIIACTRNIVKAKSKFKMYRNIKFISYEHNVSEHIDYIIHFASPTESEYFVTNPSETFNSIVSLTNRFLLVAKKHKARFLYISSMEVYGQIYDRKPKKEDELGYISLDSPRSSYPLGKRSAEFLCNSYNKEYKVNTGIARLAQTFGPGSNINDSRLFSYALSCYRHNKNIILKTDGQSYGNYVYLSDCIRAILFILFKGKSGETYNVVNEKANVKIINFCKFIANNRVKVVCQISKNNFAKNTSLKMSSKKLLNLGWKPKYDLKETVNRFINYSNA